MRQLSNHIYNPFIRLHAPLSLSIEPNIKTLAHILTELWPFNDIGRRWPPSWIYKYATERNFTHPPELMSLRPLLTHINHQKSLYNISTLRSHIFSIFLLTIASCRCLGALLLRVWAWNLSFLTPVWFWAIASWFGQIGVQPDLLRSILSGVSLLPLSCSQAWRDVQQTHKLV